MLDMQLDLAIKTEKQIERKLKRFPLVSNENKEFWLNYIEMQHTFNMDLCNYLEKIKEEKILTKLIILKLLLEKNTFYISIIKSSSKIYAKTIK